MYIYAVSHPSASKSRPEIRFVCPLAILARTRAGRTGVAAAWEHAHLFFFVTFHPGDNIGANGTSQKWTPLGMLPEPGSMPRKLTEYLPSARPFRVL